MLSKHSVKYNKARIRRFIKWRRQNMFQTGHPHYSCNEDPVTEDWSATVRDSVTSNYESTIKRIDRDLFTVACNPLTPDILPTRLRPEPAQRVLEVESTPDRLRGNIIVDVTKCETHFNTSVRDHIRRFPNCSGDVVFDTDAFAKRGLGIAGKLICTEKCGFVSLNLKFYRELETTGRGRRGAAINTQLQVVLTKQPIGNAGIRELLAAIDLPSPSESGLQKKANQVSDAFVGISKEQLCRNRALVQTVVSLRNQCPTDQIVAQSDVAYNNPIKGTHFYQPGTQCWAPCFPGEPGLQHIPIAFSTRSKVCSCKNSIHKNNCKRNFEETKAMGNAELDLGKDLALELTEEDCPLGVTTIVTDGDSSLHKGVKEIMVKKGINTEKGDCTRHITKSIGRNIRKAQLSLRCTGEAGTTQKQRSHNKAVLASFIERRCVMEFRTAYRTTYRKYGHNIGKLLHTCKPLKIGIMGCIQGYGDVCRQSSLVCYAHRKKKTNKAPPGLPGQNYVRLTRSDAAIVERWIDNKLGPTAIVGQQHNITTNRCEASHLTVLRGLPKCRNHLRNFDGRARSAVHSMSLGAVDSVLMANKVLGAINSSDCPASATRQEIRCRDKYFKARRKTLAYRKANFARQARARRLRQHYKHDKHTGYSSGVQHPVVRHDHRYDTGAPGLSSTATTTTKSAVTRSSSCRLSTA